ncbi:MAG: type II toxin-antitoxin system RelE/ParE family toxin [bacterium]|nr:type II toxin-antitoxin system RelE/ParE family toxin [bacterium]MDZ4285387.1 type II toxin-antitoxin system RelE/ParE family toxin [Candidatus Sungbacteria bacterium]
MNWNVTVNSSVHKTLKRIPRTHARQMIEVFDELSIDPYAGDIRKMKGEEDVWRRRIGSYRIKYEIQTPQKIIRILEVTRRASNTY